MLHDPRPLSDLFPAIAHLPGEPPFDVLGGPVFRYLKASGTVSWEALGRMSPAFIAELPHVGPTRLNKVIAGISELTEFQAATVNVSDPAMSVAARALVEIASWATGTAGAHDLGTALRLALTSDDPLLPVAAVRSLNGLVVEDLADVDLVATYDPVLIAERFLDSLAPRERDILDRLLDLDGSAPTLEELGLRYGVTRQRIQQIEPKLRAKIESSRTAPAHRALNVAAERLRERIGSAIPFAELEGEFAQFPPDQVDRLILHLAGPYERTDDWFTLDDLGPISSAVLAAFEQIEVDGWAPLDAMWDALAELGIHQRHREASLAATPDLRIVEDNVVDWRGSMNGRAVRILAMTGRPMLQSELAEAIEPNSAQGLSNALHADDRINKVGLKRFALRTWNLDDYTGVVPAMVEGIEAAGAPIQIDALATSIASEFGASENSVKILASTHPAFIAAAGTVRLRRADEPYEPSNKLEETRHCFVVGGVWAWRTRVDRDVLRGSGRAISEAFAVHLGLTPLEKGEIDTSQGTLAVRWGQVPAVGSLRSAAQSLEAELDDYLFVLRSEPGRLEFRVLRAADLPDDPATRLRMLVGASTDRPVAEVLADALGLTGSHRSDLDGVRQILERRRESDLVALLDATNASD